MEGSGDGSTLGMFEDQQGGHHYLDRVGIVEWQLRAVGEGRSHEDLVRIGKELCFFFFF